MCTGGFGGNPRFHFFQDPENRPSLQSPFLGLPGEERANLELPLHTLNNGSLSPSHFTERIIRLRCPGH